VEHRVQIYLLFFFLSPNSFCLTTVRCRGIVAFDHTQGHTTVGRTPLDEGLDRRRDRSDLWYVFSNRFLGNVSTLLMLMFTYVEIYSCAAKRITNMTLLTVLKPNMSLQKDSEVSFSKFLENYKKSSVFCQSRTRSGQNCWPNPLYMVPEACSHALL
jgi:hypothetical protein